LEQKATLFDSNKTIFRGDPNLMNGFEYLLVALAAMAGGAINALAGGGTLITFPMLIAVGVPAVSASVTNTVALCPGYLGATLAQFKDLQGQQKRLWWFVPASAVGGILGGILLLNTGEQLFRAMVPYLILLASALLAGQNWLRAWLVKHAEQSQSGSIPESWAAWPVGLAAIYGGYFGAGLSVIVLAVLGLVLDDSLTRLNGLKQAIALSVNIAAAIFFLFSGQVVWSMVLVMAAGSLVGGMLGGKLAGTIQPQILRRVVVTIGILVAVIYLIR
jgi:hypothetical protein